MLAQLIWEGGRNKWEHGMEGGGSRVGGWKDEKSRYKRVGGWNRVGRAGTKGGRAEGMCIKLLKLGKK